MVNKRNFIGGYKIFDFENIALDPDTPVIIPGIYDRIEETRGKPLLLQNFIIPDTTVPINAYVIPQISGTDYLLILGAYIDAEKNVIVPAITITDDNEVTYTQLTNETEENGEVEA